MKNYTDAFMGEESPFYRPNPYNKFSHFRSPQSKVKSSNYTLPIHSSIEDLKMNNPFQKNISISSINASKTIYHGYAR